MPNAARAASARPAIPAGGAAYLAERSATRDPRPAGGSGWRLILAGLAHHHRRAGHLWTPGDPVISSIMRGIVREQKRPMRPADTLCYSASMPGWRGRRNCALLVIGLAGARRRSELVATDREDLRFTPEGLMLRIRSSKTDQEGKGVEVGAPKARGPSLARCALQAWLKAGVRRKRRRAPWVDQPPHDRRPSHRE